MRDITEAFRALSNGTRLRIINLLLERECCVCHVMEVLDITEPRASRNLSILYDAGFLKRRRQGLWAWYSIDKECLKGRYYADLIEAVKKALERNETASLDRRRLKSVERAGLRCASKVLG